MMLADFSAVLFDMDGTLVDTEPLWHQAEISVFADHGIPWSVEQALGLTGLNMPAVATFMQDRGVALPAPQIIEALAARVLEGMRSHVRTHEDVVAVLSRARELQLATALVTMSPRTVARAALARLPEGSFDLVITAEDVTNGKPHPEPYLLAAERLGRRPASCLVIEDSRYGIAAGLAAGCTVLSVGPLAGQIAEAPALSGSLTL